MEPRQIAGRVAKITLFISLFVSLGVYSGIRNADDTIFQDLKIIEIEDEVQVYRNNLGVPTIIANNIKDMAFVQGYEFARDRTFQLELYHALINAKLSTIFGFDLLEADVMIKSLDFKAIGMRAEAKLDQFYLEIVGSYVNGINLYYEQHEFNLPWEFQVLGINPSIWEISDSLSMQAVLAYYFNFDGFANELKRLTTIKKVGMSKSLELFPIESQSARNFLLNSNATYNALETEYEDPFSTLFLKQDFQAVTGNNWVINGSNTISGNPIMANDLSMRLSIPSFWYEVNLQLSHDRLNVQGLAIPGLPLVLIGHNQDLAWGVGESNIDSVDLLYFNSNTTHYYHDGLWKEYDVRSYEFDIAGFPAIDRKIYKTVMGPILNISEGWYSVQWTLLENMTRDLMFQSIYLLNTATSITDAHLALEYLTAPSI
ncbi:MAG: penicillin acylase family protein, partial [Candidatus Heimdallarchaeota archaeon]|nr:penicillin acylase family protein [Candidatus Heimdallarchaeota archaeon]